MIESINTHLLKCRLRNTPNDDVIRHAGCNEFGLTLLYDEARQNFLKGYYPCKEKDIVHLAAISTRILYGNTAKIRYGIIRNFVIRMYENFEHKRSDKGQSVAGGKGDNRKYLSETAKENELHFKAVLIDRLSKVQFILIQSLPGSRC
ncbi:hypothetical protein COOONC_18807 [Cooperia oncophora]